jgi:hypothetical protein
MELNLTGLSAALATFFGIWGGHVAVRKFEANLTDLRPAMGICVLLGFGMWTGALLSDSMPVSAGLGILGMTLLWDAFEFYRQEKRIKTGHAPANPNNPRHKRILAEYPSATTTDWLDRHPRGAAYLPGELTEDERPRTKD